MAGHQQGQISLKPCSKEIISKEKENIHTPLGIELIATIQNDLLKSPELTGQWEYKLRQIEKDFTAQEFKSIVSNDSSSDG